MTYFLKTFNFVVSLPLVAACLLCLAGVCFTLVEVNATADVPPSNMTINLQKTEFVMGEEVKASGRVSTQTGQETVEVVWTRPNGKTVIDHTLPGEDGMYEAVYRLDSEEDRGGRWAVRASYAGNATGLDFLVRDPFFSFQFDRSEYENGDSLILKISLDFEYQDIHRVALVIIDPKGNIINSEPVFFEGPPTFYYTFKLLEPNPVYGKWLVEVSYADRYRSVAAFDVVESQISVKTDKNFFVPGTNVTISGQIGTSSLDKTNSDIELSILDPNGQKFEDVQTQLGVNNTFMHKLALSGPSAANYGQWFIVAKFEDQKGIASFTVQKYPHTIMLGTDQKFYSAGETITVLGRVSEILPANTVKISLYDPSQTFIAFAEVEISDDYTYRHRFESDTLNLQPGNYTVAAKQGSAEKNTGFVVSEPSNVKPITLKTNKQSYNATNAIIASGKISQGLLDIDENLNIVVRNNKTGELVYEANSVVYNTTNGVFLQVLKKSVEQWQPSIYTVNVEYGQESASANFNILNASSTTVAKIYKVKIGNGTTFDIAYNITGGSSIKGISIDQGSKSLNVTLNTAQNGKLKVILPRGVIDSLNGDGIDREYVVRAISNNGSFAESSVVEVTNSSDVLSRVLEIEFDQNTTALNIQGTSIIPEFGPFLMSVAAISIIFMAIVATFRKASKSYDLQ